MMPEDDVLDSGQGLWSQVAGLVRGYLRDFTLVRLASHVAVVLVVALVLVFSQVDVPSWEVTLPGQAQPLAVADDEDGALPLVSFWPNRGGSYMGALGALTRAAVPFTTIPDRSRLDVVTHIVQPGDTLSGIATMYKLSLETVMWAGGLELCPNLLRVNQELLILPVDGVHHTVEEGDTLSAIAAMYKVPPRAIVAWEANGLENEDSPLIPGAIFIVPGGSKETIRAGGAAAVGETGEPSRVGSGQFAWPASGRVLDWFNTTTLGGRGVGAARPWPHKGVDISAYTGAAIMAADSGVVTVAKSGSYNGGYGTYVVISHGNGFSTLYAHMSRLFVQRGDVLAKGQRVGAAGATGMATGPHLHFEIRYNGVQRNPLCFLSVASR